MIPLFRIFFRDKVTKKEKKKTDLFQSVFFLLRSNYSMVAPKGMQDSFANLKDCRPKGIPMMVMQ